MWKPALIIVSAVAVVAGCWSSAALAAEGRIPVSGCQTISASGSYLLTQDLNTTCTCLTIAADDVNLDLDGHVITMSSGNSNCMGVIGQEHTNITVKNGMIKGGGIGVYFSNYNVPGNYVIEKLVVSGMSYSAINMETGCPGSGECGRAQILDNIIKGGSDPSAAGIKLFKVKTSLIERNSIWNCNTGIILEFSRDSIIRKNSISGMNAHGVMLNGSDSNLVVENAVSNTLQHGIYLIDSSNNTLRGNGANGNQLYGINIHNGQNNNLTYNTAGGNYAGIMVEFNAKQNSIDWNQVSGNSTYGIRFDSTTADNVYSNNRSMGAPISDATCNPTCANRDAGGNEQ